MAAAKRKERPLVGTGRDGRDHQAFIDALLKGEISAVALDETTVPDGTHTIRLPRFDAEGKRVADVEVTYVRRRMTRLEYLEP